MLSYSNIFKLHVNCGMGDYVYKYNVILCTYNVIWVQSMDVQITWSMYY